MPRYTNPHRYVDPPKGRYNCKVCNRPVVKNWSCFRGYYYHKKCLHKWYPKLRGGAV